MFARVANADVPAPTPTPEVEYVEVQTVDIRLKPTVTPVSIPTPVPGPKEIVIKSHDINENDVKRVARLLWSSPLRDRTAKAALVWVVCNRVDHLDFPSTIRENITTSEVTYFDSHAHLSDENLEIARLVLNQWLSERDGYNAGRLVPTNGLYIRYSGVNNRSIEILDSKPTETHEAKSVYYPMAGAYEY
jgi:hypothetical protein